MPTKEQIEKVERAAMRPIVSDSDCEELSSDKSI